MNIEKSLDIIKGKLLMIDKMLKQDQEEGHGSAYEMQKEDFEAIETLLTAYEKEKEKNKELIKERATEIVYVDKNFVRKDKIKAKIEEYYEYDKRMQNKPDGHTTKYYEAKALEKLLEE